MRAVGRTLPLLRPYLGIAVGALLALLIVTATNLYAPQLVRRLIDDGLGQRDRNAVIFATVGLLLVALIRGLFNFVQGYWSEKLSQGMAFDLRNAVYTRLATLSFSYHDRNQTGQLMTRLTSDVEAVRLFYAQGLLPFLSALATLVGSAVILFRTDWRLALAALSTVPLMGLLFGLLFVNLFPRFRRTQERLGVLSTVLQENIAGVRIVKSFAAEPRELGRYGVANQALYDESMGVVRLFSLGFPFIFFLANLGTLIVIWYGGNRVISGALSLGTLIAFNTYLAFLLMPIFQLGLIAQVLSRAAASAERLFEILDEVHEIADRPAAQPLPPIGGQVRFDEVTFRYPGSPEPVLRSLSFVAEPGQTVAIVGPTGSGKSSVIALIPRFYDVTGGAVRVDGVDVRDITLDSLRAQIGVVLQEATLVSGTIRDNVAFGRPDATDQQVEQAARAAQAHAFIAALPEGYGSLVGERGVGLSGGQRQRIAIARALLVDPRILIFDDSTSAVDAQTEAEIQAALTRLLVGRTAFVIAQRLSTVRNADRILLLDRGEIADQGTHAELLERSPLYAEVVGAMR